MKGIVFTEFIEMIEEEHGLELSDRVIQGANLPNDGAYTAVGTYDHEELIQLLASLSTQTETNVPELVRHFGRHLFHRFQVLYPGFFEGIDSALELLPSVESYIHVEVRKLYPEAKLPTFECKTTNGALEIVYQSARPFADLAEGLICACVENYHQENICVQRTDLGDRTGTSARFVLTPRESEVSTKSAESCLS